MGNSKIAVCGSINVDVIAYAAKMPRDGESVFGLSAALGVGGKGLNQAVAAKRAGGDVNLIARIGDDALSTFAIAQLEKESIGRNHIKAIAGANTGCALIEVNESSGENRIIAVQGANALLTDNDVSAAEDVIADCDIALSQFETSFDAVNAFVNICKIHNKIVIINPAPFSVAPDEFYCGIDYLTPNETEAEKLCGIKIINEASIEKAANAILNLGVKHVIITLGAKGAYYTDKERCFFSAAPHVNAVDTTGAGDAFNGALAYMLANGSAIESAIAYSNCYAALSVTRKGTCVALPTRDETLNFMKDIHMCL